MQLATTVVWKEQSQKVRPWGHSRQKDQTGVPSIRKDRKVETIHMWFTAQLSTWKWVYVCGIIFLCHMTHADWSTSGHTHSVAMTMHCALSTSLCHVSVYGYNAIMTHYIGRWTVGEIWCNRDLDRSSYISRYTNTDSIATYGDVLTHSSHMHSWHHTC